jgi:EAL domain-containing protein (putative c-di-GMP-specific phosphodiesterase class I)
VLHEACRQATRWPGLHRMAVNVSPVQFRRPDFFGQVQHALQETGLDPARLEIEITEGVLLHETADQVDPYRTRRNGFRRT